MVAEVEIRNTVESVKIGSLYPPYTTDPEVGMVTGWVSNNGQLLHIDVNRELVSGYARIMYLYYSIVDTDYRKVDYNLIKVADVVTLDMEATAYEFDISSVLTIPRRTNRVVDINEITIDLFTYEANITDATGTAIYGTKRLSVPYSSEADASVAFPTSTDGWYPIGLVDYLSKDMLVANTVIFNEGDLVYWTNDDVDPVLSTGVYKALTTTLSGPLTEDKWIEATDEDIMKFFTLPPNAAATSAVTVVGANAIISRYVKKEYIADVLPRVSYKTGDDKRALYSLMKLMAIRENSILKLEKGDMVSASYLLDTIRNEHDAFYTAGEDIILTQIGANYTI